MSKNTHSIENLAVESSLSVLDCNHAPHQMRTHSSFSRLSYSSVPRLVTVTLVALTWSSLAFCGEIHDAVAAGNLEKVKLLLKDNPDLIFSKNTNGSAPLHVAAGSGHKDVAEFLLANKADVSAANNFGDTPLHVAAAKGHRDVAELLLASGANVNATNNYDDTPSARSSGKWTEGRRRTTAGQQG
jgi:ankyrin repeat protein